ncbi:hypothetical protein, partial [Pseudomonas aeruginosa]|uniref:hypothetical protein n=1 Tax=Pseudomonas aeruginosa TaxID=287 RepID=UPI0039C3BE37
FVIFPVAVDEVPVDGLVVIVLHQPIALAELAFIKIELAAHGRSSDCKALVERAKVAAFKPP